MDERPALPLPPALKFRRPEAPLVIPDSDVPDAAAMVPFDAPDDTVDPDKGDEPEPPGGEDLDLEDIKRRIKAETQKLLKASGPALAAITRKLQRLRVAKMLLVEVDGASDPNVHRELTLLNKLLAAEGASNDDASAQDEAASRQRAQDLIQARGGSPQSAENIARVLSSVMLRGQQTAASALSPAEAITDDDLDNPKVDEQLTGPSEHA